MTGISSYMLLLDLTLNLQCSINLNLPFRRLSAAILKATNEDEQAVSTVKLGPVKLNANEILFEIIEAVVPVAAN